MMNHSASACPPHPPTHPTQLPHQTTARSLAPRVLATAPAARQPAFPLFAGEGGEKQNKLPMLLDVETRGGILFVSTLGTAAIFGGYNVATALGVDGLQAGIYISVAMTIGMVAWTLSYIFRVANKDMTYAKQLKNYEDAVLAKRLEELEAEEVEALLEEVEKEGTNMKR